MSLTLTSPLKDSLETSSHYHCNCWSIVRQDGFALAFTDHNSRISLAGYGFVFEPSGGWSQSARQRQTTLEDENLEIMAVFSADAITDADLYAGRYDQATIVHYFVDWRVPEYGPISTSVYSMPTVTFTSESWQAEVVGLTGQLKPKIGNSHSRSCSFLLGDADTCGVNLGALSTTIIGVRVNAAVDRANFDAYDSDIPATGANDTYNLGTITWTTGLNSGISSEVQDYTDTGRVFSLQLSVPFTIQQGDRFDLTVGCDKNLTTCNTKFSNAVKFGGSPFMPGTDALVQTASQRMT